MCSVRRGYSVRFVPQVLLQNADVFTASRNDTIFSMPLGKQDLAHHATCSAWSKMLQDAPPLRTALRRLIAEQSSPTGLAIIGSSITVGIVLHTNDRSGRPQGVFGVEISAVTLPQRDRWSSGGPAEERAAPLWLWVRGSQHPGAPSPPSVGIR